jgi:BirA family biotin operon repressor/biotin-[acetyl-CoA-carboxylase] ligase
MMSAAPPSWRVQAHENLASTQDAAIAAARAGDPGRLAILAHTQTAGRGSRGRGWTSPPGNLNLSVLLRPETPLPPGLYALLAGVALHKALSPYANNLMLKWPNDVLLDGAKLGGILIDASFDSHGTPAWFVIGIGANLAMAPDIAGRQTAALPPPAPNPRDIAENILNALDTTEDIRREWLKRAHQRGTRLHIETSYKNIDGAFQGITETGALRLAHHAEPISSGEVFLGLCPSAPALEPVAFRCRARRGNEAIPPDPQHFLEVQKCCS